MTDHPARLGPADYLVAAAINTLWGLNIVAMKVTVDEAGAFMAGAIRLGAVMLICLPWLRHTRGRVRTLVLLGIVNGGLFPLFMNLALKISTNVGALVSVGQLAVPSSVILGVLLLGDRITG
jgi:O-acetylserine/cysteine efflux transporter